MKKQQKRLLSLFIIISSINIVFIPLLMDFKPLKTESIPLNVEISPSIMKQFFQDQNEDSGQNFELNVQQTDFNHKHTVHAVFRENKGQFPDYIYYYTISLHGTVGFGESMVYFSIDGHFFRLEFLNANLVRPKGMNMLKGSSNYFIGKEVYTGIQHFSQVGYNNLYDGISLRYKLTSKGLKYEFIVQPYADINKIKLAYVGVDEIFVSPQQVTVSIADVRFIDNELDVWYFDSREKIPVVFEHVNDFSYSEPYVQFLFPKNYDPSKTIVIDPYILGFSTFLGGDGGESGEDIALDSMGNVYVAGGTTSDDFPIVGDAINSSRITGFKGDVYVAKLSSDGSTLLYSTFIVGSEIDIAYKVALDTSDNVYIIGSTDSSDFPMVNSYNSTHGGQHDVFVAKLTSNLSSIQYSTFIGGRGDDTPSGFVVTLFGDVYLAGFTDSTDFPTSSTAFNKTHNGKFDGFVCRLSNSYLVSSTFIGGSSRDIGWGGIEYVNNEVYVTGYTNSSDFPTVNAYNSKLTGSVFYDIFVAKLKWDLSAILYSTYLGGSSEDIGVGIAVDALGNAFITGHTKSSDFPTINANDYTFDGSRDCIVAGLSEDGSSLIFSTYLGGSSVDMPFGINLMSTNNLCIVGYTTSIDFPTTKNAFNANYSGAGGGVSDGFIAQLSNDGSSLYYSTFFGGSSIDYILGFTLDSSDNVYFTGQTHSADLPTSENAYDTSINEESSIFISKFIEDSIPPIISLVRPTINSINKSGITIKLEITDNFDLNQVLYNWDISSNQTLSFPYDLTLIKGDGQHTLNVFAQDGAKNWIMQNYQFITDDTPPTATFSGIADLIVVKELQSINVFPSDANEIMKVEFILDNSLIETDYSPPYTWVWDTTESSNGNHEVKIRVTDVAGNEYFESFTVKVDNPDPEAQFTKLITDLIPIIAGGIVSIIAGVILFLIKRKLGSKEKTESIK